MRRNKIRKLRDPRYDTNYCVKYRFYDKLYDCILLNISESGVNLRFTQIFDIGDKIILVFLNEGRFIEAEIEVKIIYINNQFLGAQFCFNHNYEKTFIKNFINEIKYNMKNHSYKSKYMVQNDIFSKKISTYMKGQNKNNGVIK